MAPRDRALFATSALLYSGPLYAGLAGYGLQWVPLFAVIFMLWLFVVRPGDWPATPKAWASPRAIAWPLLIFSVQMILVAFCLGVGRAVGGLFGIAPPLPLVFTLLVSMLAIALARLFQRRSGGVGQPGKVRIPGDELGIGSGILDVGKPQMPGSPDPEGYVEGVMTALADLQGGGASGAAMADLADRVERDGMAPAILAALAKAPDSPAYRQLDAELALRPGVARETLRQGHIERVIARTLATRQAALIECVADAGVRLISELPGAAREMPPSNRLEAGAAEIAAVSPGAGRALLALVTAMDKNHAV